MDLERGQHVRQTDYRGGLFRVDERMLLHESGTELSHGDEITESECGIRPPIIKLLFVEPPQRFTEEMIALVRMAVLVIKTRYLVWCHLLDGFGAVNPVGNLEALVDVIA